MHGITQGTDVRRGPSYVILRHRGTAGVAQSANVTPVLSFSVATHITTVGRAQREANVEKPMLMMSRQAIVHWAMPHSQAIVHWAGSHRQAMVHWAMSHRQAIATQLASNLFNNFLRLLMRCSTRGHHECKDVKVNAPG